MINVNKKTYIKKRYVILNVKIHPGSFGRGPYTTSDTNRRHVYVNFIDFFVERSFTKLVSRVGKWGTRTSLFFTLVHNIEIEMLSNLISLNLTSLIFFEPG